MILQDLIQQCHQAEAEIDPISIPNIFIVSSSFYVLTQPRPTLAMKDGTARALWANNDPDREGTLHCGYGGFGGFCKSAIFKKDTKMTFLQIIPFDFT